MSVFGELVVSVPHVLPPAYPHPRGCASPASLTRPFRSGLSPPQDFSQALLSTFKMFISGVLLFLLFTVWLVRLDGAVVR